MKRTFKSLFLKTLALVVSVCACVGFATLSGAKGEVKAEEVASFAVSETASIRDGESAGDGFYGLRFETKVNATWLSENPSEKYSFGTLIFPASMAGSFNADAKVDVNKENTEAVKFLAKNNVAVNSAITYYASIVYDRAEAARLIKSVYGIEITDIENDTRIDTVLQNLYAMEMTAVSFVQIGDEVTYTNQYTTSMIKVAARLQSDEKWAEKASSYLGNGKVNKIKTYAVDDNNIVANFDAQDVSKVVIGNDTLVAGTDYTIADGDLTLNASDVVAKKGVYEDIYVFDSNYNLTILNVLYATDELVTADDVKNALDYGKYDYVAANADYANFAGYGKHDGVYVLAGDVDMTGYTFYNNIDNSAHTGAQFKMQEAGFSGIFDGFGHSITNATVEVKNHYTYIDATNYPNLKDTSVVGTAFGTYMNMKSKGIFHDIKAGAAVRNVAFINLTAIGQADGSDATPLGGILTRSLDGTLENVYIDVNPASLNTENIKGIAFYSSWTSTVRNVVINWPMNDWVFDYNALTTNHSFAYGTGSFITSINSTTAVYENIYVMSPKPISYAGDSSIATGELEDLTVDYFTYGANENTLFYDHAVNGDKTFDELVVDYKKDLGNTQGKVRQMSNVVRYDSAEDAAESTDETTVNMRNALATTGYFKVVNGQVLWHTMKAQEVISSPIDYNAATGELITTELAGKEILSVSVGSEKLTVANGGLVEEDGVYTLRAKTSADDDEPGVPYIDNTKDTPDQIMSLTVETEEVDYTLNNVSYWSALISTAAEFKAYIEIDPGTSYSSKVYNKGLYKLVGDIDFVNEDETLVTMDYAGRSTSNVVYAAGQNGFAGVFDGNGYTMKNFVTKGYGLFSSLTSYQINGNTVVVKDFAMTNVSASYIFSGTTVTYGPVLAHAMHYDSTASIEVSNIYVQVNPSSVMTAGLITIPSAQLKMNNVFVEYNKAAIAAPSAYVFDADYSSADGKTYISYNPTVWNASLCNSGTLFRTLRRAGTTMDNNVTNVYIASPQPVASQSYACSSIYGMWTHDATNKTHTLTNNGYTTGTSGWEYYYGYASNETRGTVPVIKEMSEDFATISLMDGFFDNSVKTAYPCNVCNRITTTAASGAACDITENCTGKFVNSGPSGIWDEIASYIWTFHDVGEGYVNQAISGSNGIWKFSGVKKYDTVELMKAAGNTYDTFTNKDTGYGLWAVNDGALTWVGNAN